MRGFLTMLKFCAQVGPRKPEEAMRVPPGYNIRLIVAESTRESIGTFSTHAFCWRLR